MRLIPRFSRAPKAFLTLIRVFGVCRRTILTLIQSSRVRQLNLPEDWLNDGAKGFLHGIARGEVVFQTQALTVRALAPPQLLAMKLSAWRDDLDIEDARLLLSKIAGNKERIWEQVKPYLVPGRELKSQYAFEDLWDSEHADQSSD